MPGLFDLTTPELYLRSLERLYARHMALSERDSLDLMLVIAGLTHLREWIAPGYPREWEVPTTPAQHFHHELHDIPEFQVLRDLCNASKHGDTEETSTTYDMTVDEWPDIDSLESVDHGPPRHRVRGRPVEEFIDPVMKRYRRYFEQEAADD